MKHVDLTDMDIYVDDYKLISNYKGSGGSWYEPASPPEREYSIRKIVVEGLKDWGPEEIADILALEPKDTIKIDLYFDGETGDDVELTEDKLEVESVKLIDNGKALEIGIDAVATWVGHTPPQSHSGRD